jgi:hypothetical protein
LIGGYLYYEIHKLKVVINEIQYQLNQRDQVIIHEDNITPMNNNEDIETNQPPRIIEESHPHIIHSKNNEWSDIHQQMNHTDDITDDINDDISDISSVISDYIQEDVPPENNSANIDEILAGKSIITDNSLSDILNVDSDLTKIDEFINVIKESELTKLTKLTKTATTDYEKMTVSQLKKILSDKDLPVSGNKTKLIERIKENNEYEV